MMLFGKVDDVFIINGRGCVVVFSWLTDNVRVRVKDQIQLRTPDGNLRDTYIAGVETMCGPKVDWSKLGICLPKDIGKQDVPRGTELWLSRDERGNEQQ